MVALYLNHVVKETILSERDVPGTSLTKDPANCSILEDKCWLEFHTENKSGRKQELVDRVQACVAIGKTGEPKVYTGKWYEVKNLHSEGGKTFLSNDIPAMFNYGHIYYHLVESISDFAFVEREEDAEDLDSGYTTTVEPLKKD